MSLDQVQTAVEAYIAAHWTATAIAYENTGYVPTSDGNGTLTPWLLVEVQGGLTEQRSLGTGDARSNLWIESGTLWAHVFVGSETGSLLAKQLGAQFAELFRGLELDPLIAFGDMTLAGSGGTEDGNNWSLSVSIDWMQG
jgi:Bacteriophage related domain of unknown function